MYKQILFSLCAVAFLACNRTKTVSTEKAETGVCPQITNIQARCSTSLDGEWNYIVDIYHFHLDVTEEDVTLQDSEAIDCKFASWDEIQQLAADGVFLHFSRLRQALEAEGVRG